jgi:hypothetical protein
MKRYGRQRKTLLIAQQTAGAPPAKLPWHLATLAFGGFFQPVGAGFQSYFRGLTEFVLQNETTIPEPLSLTTFSGWL